MKSMSHSLLVCKAAIILVWWTTIFDSSGVQAKKVSGDFKLSGVHTEHVLTSFAVMPGGAKLDLTFTSDTMYENELALKFHMYRDTEWRKFRKLQLCNEKIRLAKYTKSIEFEYMNRKWQSKNIEFDIEEIPLEDPKRRNHYWYFVIDDCSLEEYYQDSKIPKLHFELTIQNWIVTTTSKGGVVHRRLTHLSADEESLAYWHLGAMLLSILVSFVLMISIFWRMSREEHSVHAAVLIVASAAALDAASAMCELIHLAFYNMMGVGSYVCDCLAAHMEACCDAVLMILLISIGAGWTLPSTVVQVPTTNASPMQKLLAGLSHPIANLTSGKMNTSKYLVGSVFLIHIILAQWGRTYDDDFESYHHLEHMPGKILMWLRVAGGILFAAAVTQTRASSKITTALDNFYKVFGLAGFGWFVSLPALTWFCNWSVPYYLRRPTVFIGSAVLQSGSLLLLAWLVTTHSTGFHKFSRMNAQNATDTLADELPGIPGSTEARRSWKLTKRVKVNID